MPTDPAPTEHDVRQLLLEAADVDGWPDISAGQNLPREFAGTQFHAVEDDELVAFATLNRTGDAHGRQTAELIVRPRHRGKGHGTRLLDDLVADAEGTLRIWSHGDHPAAAALAARTGFQPVRKLLRMSAPARAQDVPAPPAGVRIRPFEPGRDEDAVARVNARAFDWHPEQGAMTAGDVRAAESESWFDPDGFLLAVEGEKVLGFHWTKIHAGESGDVGEVYVVGVDPSAQGTGLGKLLTLAGLHYLYEQGVEKFMLYVEGDNRNALAMYENLTFTTDSVAVQYQADVEKR